MRTNRALWRGVVWIALVALVVAACGDDDGNADASGGDDGDQKELVIASAVEPETLDLANLIDASMETWQFLDPIVQRMPDGTYRPMLAESLPEQVDPEDPLTWQFTLREGLVYHDGTPVDAAAVLEWIEYVASFEPRTKEIVDVAQSFTPTAVDDRTIEVVFKNAGFAGVGINSALSRILVAKAGVPDIGTNPVGTGPYQVAEWNRGQNLVLERNEDYWGDAPPFDSVQFRFIPDAAARVAALSSGEVDLISDLNVEDAQAVSNTITGPTTSWFMFQPDSLGVFSDVRLRQALYHALDLETIHRELYGEMGLIHECQLGNETYTGYNPDLTRYEYDPDRARELVAEAGAEGLSFRLLAAPNQPRFAELAEVAVEMWQEIGLDPNLDLVAFEQFVPQVVDLESQPDIFLLARGMDTLDYEGYTVIAHPSSGLSSNDDTELHALLDEAAQTADVDEREEILQEVAARTCESAYGIFVLNPDTIFGASEGLQFEPSPYGSRFTRVADMTMG